MDMSSLAWALAALLILVGLAGTVLPALPGLPLMFAGMWLGAWADGYHRVGGWTIGLLGVLTVLSLGVDIAATAMGAKRVGAGKLAMVGAAVGTLVGGIFFSIPGLILGPFVGAVLGELARGKELRQASSIGFGTWVGLAIGTALKLALAFAMLGIFVLALVVP
jgi:uncharacterized protein YqgC (DUF456 family)